MAIATGIYLFDIEESNNCIAPQQRSDRGSTDPDRFTNVSRRFYVILAIFFTFWVIEAVRALFVLLSTITRVHVISLVHTILCLNELLGIAAIVTLCLYRFQYSGRLCSCFNIDNNEQVGDFPYYCDNDNLTL